MYSFCPEAANILPIYTEKCILPAIPSRIWGIGDLCTVQTLFQHLQAEAGASYFLEIIASSKECSNSKCCAPLMPNSTHAEI